MKLADDWWNQGRNPITGYKAPETAFSKKTITDEVKYFNAYPTLEIKEK